MKIIKTEVYSFEELSDEAKQKAVEDHRDLCSGDQPAWSAENRQTMEKFSEIFPIKVTNWSYGERSEGVSFHFEAEDYIEELSGFRLAKYLWNNYKGNLFKGKFYGNLKTNEFVKHKRIKSSELYKNGNRFNPYYSAIKLDSSCVLTGYFMDDNILGPIYDFLNKPTNINFRDLLEDCYFEWIKACNADIEWQNSNEYLSEELINNRYEFEEDGSKF